MLFFIFHKNIAMLQTFSTKKSLLAMLKMCLVLLWLLGISKICHTKNPTFRNWDSCFFQLARKNFMSFKTTIWQNKDPNLNSKLSLASFMDARTPSNESTICLRRCICTTRLRGLEPQPKMESIFLCHICSLQSKFCPSQLSLSHILTPNI